ncbi:hypothetical protein JZ751_013369 [Albula glossodonta]|uniref:G-protein coupled receptors family 1 profile domain-containing protein n=1 Tax=Albula glossodonta TaxID=121402 RepID=A0A8T2N029_9TELE|nr:hypothetical protein JZ751_013369 [Albula glossodonta]
MEMASPFISVSDGFYNVGAAPDPTSSFLGVAGVGNGEMSGFRVMMAVLYLLVCAAGLGGNALVIAATLKVDRLGSATTVYVFNLALADGLFMVSLPFVAFQNFRNSWPFGDAACRLVMVLDGVNQFTSVFCLTAMSVDRYVALGLGPGRLAGWRTARRAKVVAAFLWLLSLVPVLPMALHFSASSGLCSVEPPSGYPSLDAWWLVFLSYTFVLGFALPFAIMTVAYGALLVAMRGRRGDGRLRSPESQRQESQVTRMVVAVVLTFAVCWLPFYVLNFCSLWLGGDLLLDFSRGFEVVVLLSYSWSCANPVLYACLSDTFHRHFRALLCPRSAAQPPGRPQECVTEGFDLHDDSDGNISEPIQPNQTTDADPLCQDEVKLSVKSRLQRNGRPGVVAHLLSYLATDLKELGARAHASPSVTFQITDHFPQAQMMTERQAAAR